jgi:pimeloyl-ACP methyl ester carboxylesterase
VDTRTTESEFFTPSGVRLRRRVRHPGRLNWLLLPGGPGIGSESLIELADLINVSGSVWLVDLPGDGANLDPPGAADEPFTGWPDVLLEAAQALPDCVYVGHSTGGMYLLSVPELARHVGIVLASSAPDSSWHSAYITMTQQDPLPEFDTAVARFAEDKTNENLRDVAVASAPWNFMPSHVDAGRGLLSRMPYNNDAVEWSDRHFDHSYRLKWWPESLPVLILSGSGDRIVDQRLWQQDRLQQKNVMSRTVPNAGHFFWIENPSAVAEAFTEFDAMIRVAVQ